MRTSICQHPAAWIAWSLCIATWLLVAFCFWLLRVNDTVDAEAPAIVSFASFGIVGALIVTHRTRNTIGWLYCTVALAGVLYELGLQYYLYSRHNQPGVPVTTGLATILLWIADYLAGTLAWLLLVLFVPLLFPTGRLPSPGWRPYAWLVAGLVTIQLVATAFAPLPIDDRYLQLRNPLGIVALEKWLLPLLDWVEMLTGLCILISATALLFRYRQANHEERQQIKWFTYAAMLIPLAGLASILVTVLADDSALANAASDLLWDVAYFALPIATGIAILRHHLFDIDRLISRTLAYSVLTALLALIYFGSVVVLGNFSQQGLGLASNQLVTVVATLLIAALFIPLRRRVQEGIDRRFYRRKYDAEQVLTAFAATVRNETNLEQLTAQLVGAARDTMQPRHISLWLKAPRLAPRRYGEDIQEAG